MQAQARRLVQQDRFAFFLPLELLDSASIGNLLSAQDEVRLQTWKADSEAPAWFFLDAVDELKLTGRRLSQSLRWFSRALAAHLAKAHVIISCRPSDWRPNRDLAIVQDQLQPHVVPTAPHSALDFFLEPLTRRNTALGTSADQNVNSVDLYQVRTVAMLSMTDTQIRAFVEQSRIVPNPARFLAAVSQQNAWKFCRRPLDLRDLCTFWVHSGHLGTLSQQHETNVVSKLRDDPARNDSGVLAEAKSSRGAQCLALALSLTHARAIRSPEQVVEVDEAPRALAAADILDTWTEAERQALLRRALFDPATYGRVRFHHRSVQEYLAARQLLALRDKGMSQKTLHRLLFAERYGVEVVRPSMRAVAAWLAASMDSVRKELLRREPATLLSLADPEVLDIAARAGIVRAFVAAYGSGNWRGIDIPRESVGRLAHCELGSVVRECWGNHPVNDDVRELLVTLIWLGPIPECADLALVAALDSGWRPYERLVAIRGLIACGHHDSVRRVSTDILENRPAWPDRVVHRVAADLFPVYMEVAELIALIERTTEPGPTAGGFRGVVLRVAEEIEPWSGAAVALRDRLVCLLEEQLTGDGDPTARNLRHVAPGLGVLCRRQLSMPARVDRAELIRSCVVVSRCDDDSLRQLREYFQNDIGMRSAAFWAGVDLAGAVLRTEDGRRYLHDAERHGLLGYPAEDDRPWLEAALADPSHRARRAVALFALILLWRWRGCIATELEGMRARVDDDGTLRELLAQQTVVRGSDGEVEAVERRRRRREAVETRREEVRVGDWTAWRDATVADPAGAFGEGERARTLRNLRCWLDAQAQGGSRFNTWNEEALARAFGTDVTERARRAFAGLWRRVRPELWSARATGEKNTTLVAWVEGLIGVAAEASRPGWAAALTTEEARLAVVYAAIEMNSFPPFVMDLVEAHPRIVEEILGDELEAELAAGGDQDHLALLQTVGHADSQLRELFIARLLRWLRSWPTTGEGRQGPRWRRHSEYLVRILGSATDQESQRAVVQECGRRFAAEEGEEGGAVWLRGVFRLDGARGTELLIESLRDGSDRRSRARGIEVFATVFGRGGVVLDLDSPAEHAHALGELVRHAFRFVRPADDVVHEGAYSPGVRDEAEDARRSLLSQLVDTPGPEAHGVVVGLAGESEFQDIAGRLLQMAEERTAADAEFETVFSCGDVRMLYSGLEAPAGNRDDLFAVMNDRLEDIGHELAHHDFTDRATLCRIELEPEMQRTLALRLDGRKRGAYAVSREDEVADRKRTDIRLSGAGGRYKAVIEVKIADKWTLRELEVALEEQLVGRYLRHEDCRVGCLLLTYGGKKNYWVDRTRRRRMNFRELVELLKVRARDAEAARSYGVRLSVFGLDLTEHGA